MSTNKTNAADRITPWAEVITNGPNIEAIALLANITRATEARLHISDVQQVRIFRRCHLHSAACSWICGFRGSYSIRKPIPSFFRSPRTSRK